MKNFLKFLVLLLSISCLFAQSVHQNENWASCVATDHPITAQDYCEFLNAAENQIEGPSIDDSCIIRTGSLGSYRYDVIEGKENNPISYVSWLDAVCYCDWLKNAASTSIDSLAPARLTPTPGCSWLSLGSLSRGLTNCVPHSLPCGLTTSVCLDCCQLVETPTTGILNLDSCEAASDEQLRSNRLEFYLVSSAEVAELIKKESGGATKDSSFKKFMEGAALLGGVMAGAEEKSSSLQSFASKELQAGDLSPRLQIDPMDEEEAVEETVGLIRRFRGKTSEDASEMKESEKVFSSRSRVVSNVASSVGHAIELPFILDNSASAINDRAKTEGAQRAITEARTKAQEARSKANNNWWFRFVGDKVKQKQKEAAEMAEADLARMLVAEEWRQEAAQWRVLTSQERKVALEESLAAAECRAEMFQKAAQEKTVLAESKNSRSMEAKSSKKAAATAQKAFEYWLQSISSLEAENGGLATLQQGVAEKFQVASDYWSRSAKAFASRDDSEEGKRWGEVDYDGSVHAAAGSIQHSAEALEEGIKFFMKAQETEALQDENQANAWHEIANMFRRTSDQWDRSAQIYILNHKEYGWRWAGEGTYHAAALTMQWSSKALVEHIASIVKANKAAVEGNSQEAVLWYEIAEKFQITADAWVRSSKAYSIQKKEEGDLWGKGTYGGVASSMQQAAEAISKQSNALTQAVAANTTNQKEIAAAWYEIAEVSRKVADQRSQASQFFRIGNQKEGNRLGGNKLSQGAAYATEHAVEMLEKRKDILMKIQQDKENHHLPWCKVAEKLKQAANEWRTGGELLALDDKEAYRHTAVASAFKKIAETLEKRISVLMKSEEAQESGSEQIAAAWSSVAAQLQMVADQWSEVGQAYARDDWDAGVRLGSGRRYSDGYDVNGAADLSQSAVGALENRIDALIKAQEATIAGDGKIAALWTQCAEKFQRMANYYNATSAAYASNNQKELFRLAECFCNRPGIDSSLRCDVRAFQQHIASLIEWQKAAAAGNETLATLRRDLAGINELESRYWAQGSELLFAGNKKDAHRFIGIGGGAAGEVSCAVRGLEKCINTFTQSQQAEALGKRESAVTLYKLAETQKEMVRYFYRSGEAFASGNSEEGWRLRTIAWDVAKQCGVESL